MRLLDIIGLSLITLLLFPLVLLGILLACGAVRLEYGPRDRAKPVLAAADSAAMAADTAWESRQMKGFQALEARERALADRENRARKEEERLEALRQEDQKLKEAVERARRKVEEMVGKGGELQDKKIASLAEIYGNMRPEEAAPILLGLDDKLVVRILQKVPEARSASKLLAAMAALDVKRAAQITRLLGAPPVAKAPEAPSARKDSVAAPAAAKG